MPPPTTTEEQQAELIDLETRRREAGHPPGLPAPAVGQDQNSGEPEVYAPKGCASNLTLSAETTAELLSRERERLTAPEDTYFEQLREHNRATSKSSEREGGGETDHGSERLAVDASEPRGDDFDHWVEEQAQAHASSRRSAVQTAGAGSASLPADSASKPKRTRGRARSREAGAGHRPGQSQLAAGFARPGVARLLPRARSHTTIALGVTLLAAAATTAGLVASSRSSSVPARTSTSLIKDSAVDTYKSTAGLFPSHHGIPFQTQPQPAADVVRRRGRRLSPGHQTRHILPVRRLRSASFAATGASSTASSTTPVGGSTPPVTTSPSTSPLPSAPVIDNPAPGHSANSGTASSPKPPVWGMNGSLGPGHGNGTG